MCATEGVAQYIVIEGCRRCGFHANNPSSAELGAWREMMAKKELRAALKLEDVEGRLAHMAADICVLQESDLQVQASEKECERALAVVKTEMSDHFHEVDKRLIVFEHTIDTRLLKVIDGMK